MAIAIAALAGLTFGSGLTAHAAIPTPTSEVTLAWDKSDSPDAAGYRVYWGTRSRGYSKVLSVTNGTLARITGLSTGTNYYFAVTVFTKTGLESDYSVELSHVAGQAVGPRLTLRLDADKRPVLAATGASPGATYNILARTKIDGPWWWLTSVPTDTNGTFQYTDSTPAREPSRFYLLQRQ